MTADKVELVPKSVSGLDLNCSSQPCVISVSPQAQAYGNIDFRIKVSDEARGVSVESSNLQIRIALLPNSFAPAMAEIKDVELLANETKEMILPQPSDQDGGAAVISSFAVEGFGSNFIKFTPATRQVRIAPEGNPVYHGTYIVTLEISDQQSPAKTKNVKFKVTVKSPNA